MFCAKIQQTYAKSWHRFNFFILKNKIILHVKIVVTVEVVGSARH